jgi:hypothetical protein
MATKTKTDAKRAIDTNREGCEPVLLISLERLSFLADGFPVFEITAKVRWHDHDADRVWGDSHNDYEGVCSRAFIRGANEYPVRAFVRDVFWNTSNTLDHHRITKAASVLGKIVKANNRLDDSDGYPTTVSRHMKGAVHMYCATNRANGYARVHLGRHDLRTHHANIAVSRIHIEDHGGYHRECT